jgi:hypothetical protein
MRLPVTLQAALTMSTLVGTFLLVGCFSELHCRDARDVDPGDRQCIGGGSAPEAVVTGVAAGALWAGGGGCKVAGCRPPMVCNEGSGFCENAPCGEGHPGCPIGTTCNARKLRCE